MEAPYLIVWFKDDETNAARLLNCQNSFLHQGKTFHVVSDYFGDVDYLRDKENNLVGFGYTLPLSKKLLLLYTTIFFHEFLPQNNRTEC